LRGGWREALERKTLSLRAVAAIVPDAENHGLPGTCGGVEFLQVHHQAAVTLDHYMGTFRMRGADPDSDRQSLSDGPELAGEFDLGSRANPAIGGDEALKMPNAAGEHGLLGDQR